MLIYYIFWSFLLFYCFEPQRKNKYFRIITAALFALLLGFRENVGTDYSNYVGYFKYEQYLAYLEPGYNYINKVVLIYGGSVVWVFLFMAAASTYFIFLSLNDKKVVYYPTALLCYTLCFPFLANGVRQGLAVSIFFYSYKFIEQRKLFLYLISIIGASLFHLSALILLPLYFILNKSLNKTTYIVLFLLSLVLIPISFHSVISPYLYFLGKYKLFLESEMFTTGAGLNFGAIFSFIYLIILFILSIHSKIYQKETVLFNLFFIFIIFKCMQVNSSIIGRISIYFEWFTFILLPIVIKDLKVSSIIKNLIIVFYVVVFLLLILNSYSPKYDLVPYRFY